MELEFFGAAGEVTGPCLIVRINGHTVLLDGGINAKLTDPGLRIDLAGMGTKY